MPKMKSIRMCTEREGLEQVGAGQYLQWIYAESAEVGDAPMRSLCDVRSVLAYVLVVPGIAVGADLHAPCLPPRARGSVERSPETLLTLDPTDPRPY
eukprot:357954-Rhodomonas_salina.1